MDDDFDFDRAASAFPDISLDGEGDVPSFPTASAPPVTAGFSFDDFGSPPRASHTDVKVTGDDEIDMFEDQFPDIGVGKVSVPVSYTMVLAYTDGLVARSHCLLPSPLPVRPSVLFHHSHPAHNLLPFPLPRS